MIGRACHPAHDSPVVPIPPMGTRSLVPIAVVIVGGVSLRYLVASVVAAAIPGEDSTRASRHVEMM